MNMNQTPSEIIKAHANQIAETVRDYGLPMITQLEIAHCIEAIVEAALREGQAGYPAVRIMRDPSIQPIVTQEKAAVANITA